MNKEEAIEAIRDSMRTHIDWIVYYNHGGEFDPTAGDADHHWEYLAKYQAVIDYIKKT